MSEFQKLKQSCLDRTDTVLGKIVLFMAILAGVGTLVMAVMICVSVVMRYFLSMPVAWATEWSEYLIFIDVMLATPWVLKIDKHVRVDIFSHMISKKAQKRLNQIISVLGVLMCGMFFYFSLLSLIADIQSGVKMAARIMDMPRWLVMMFIPIMSLFTIVVFIRKIIVLAKHEEIQTDSDYQEFEEKSMNPRYSTTISTDLTLPEYEDMVKAAKEENTKEEVDE